VNIAEGLIISNYFEPIKGIAVELGNHPLPTEKSIDATKK